MQDNDPALKVTTRLITTGRADERVVASPVYHASTILFKDYATLRERSADPLNREHLVYGRVGTPTTRALEDSLRELDDSVGAVLTPSGVASITDILSCFLSPGDHLLMVDSTYEPTRKFCNGALAARGIETTYYEPLLGEGIASLLRDNTRMIFMESPGTGTFEVQDVPAIVRVAHKHGILTAIDNTWATPLLFNPLDHGVDLAMQSGTKYLNGHADCLFGVTTTRDESLFKSLRSYTLSTGSHLAPDDAALAQRGLRTLGVRLRAHEAAALEVAHWLEAQPRTRRILHPAFDSCPGHAVFRRDFKGASGLFSVLLDVGDEAGLIRFVDALRLFGIGYSWGGFESLVLPMWPKRDCQSVPVADDEALLRFHIGLEDTADLLADIAGALAALDNGR
jgi:cystathionine beta-lyase